MSAAAWLRRDPYTGASMVRPVDGLTDADHAYITAIPRRYGFHAALKPVFDLAPSRTLHELERWLDSFVASIAPIEIEVGIELIDNGFAIVARRREPALDMLAARIVTEFDQFRVVHDNSEITERDMSRLSGDELNNYINWGSPNVFDCFRFHMPLTNPVPRLEREHVKTVIERHFRPVIGAPLIVGQLVLAVEPEPQAPFLVHSLHEFCVAPQLRIA
ncbi:MAG: DUF1045 domain-containing protein [Devosia sp.]